MKKYLINILMLPMLVACSGELGDELKNTEAFQPKESNASKEVNKTAEDTVDSTPAKKKETLIEEKEAPEAFFIHEGGDIKEFDEEGNPME